MQINPPTASLLDVFASELQKQLLLEHPGNTTVTLGDREDPTPSDLTWWSWSLSIDPASRILVGASSETWKAIGLGGGASCTPAVEKTAQSRFGSEVTCTEAARADAPPPEWTSAPLTITRESGADVSIYWAVSPDLESALGDGTEEVDPMAMAKVAMNSADILMDVTLPLSVSLGRTKMRMKDLLHLTNGSVVELDQEMSDEVEIRVNNCVLAYGEVVAVDGNYAVRILRMAPARGTQQERAA